MDDGDKEKVKKKKRKGKNKLKQKNKTNKREVSYCSTITVSPISVQLSSFDLCIDNRFLAGRGKSRVLSGEEAEEKEAEVVTLKDISKLRLLYFLTQLCADQKTHNCSICSIKFFFGGFFD